MPIPGSFHDKAWRRMGDHRGDVQFTFWARTYHPFRRHQAPSISAVNMSANRQENLNLQVCRPIFQDRLKIPLDFR